MASRKPIPDRSKIARERPLAYSRRQKSQGGEAGDAKVDTKPETPEPPEPATTSDAPAPAEAVISAPGIAPTDKPLPAAPQPGTPGEAAEAPAAAVGAPAAAAAAAAIEPPAPTAEPWPDATPQPMRPVEPPPAAKAEPIPTAAQVAGAVEDPTHMPGPREIPAGSPTDPATAPGRVPPGDSRSLRRGGEFALVYRVQTCVISRHGALGTRGQWRVVDYPTSSSASNAYAKECSRFVAEGFSDYRD